VTAALEELYTKLIDDNAFIELLNFITNAIEGLD
jgi:hypothetical protein